MQFLLSICSHCLFNGKTSVISATLPSVLLSNLPPDVNIQALQSAFKKFHPKSINITGKPSANVIVFQSLHVGLLLITNSLQIHVKDANAATFVTKIIQKIQFGGQNLQVLSLLIYLQ